MTDLTQLTLPSQATVAACVEKEATALLHTDPSRAVEDAVCEAACRTYRALGARLLRTAPVPAGSWDAAGEATGGVVDGLGRLHEALLELQPVLDGGAVRLVAGGAARKASGTYFTPPALVEHLLDEALEPVLTELEQEGGARRLLDVRLVDPACGAGAFLVAAARRIARRVARGRGQEPSPEDLQRARREVLAHCVHGVDRDPAVLELARIALLHDLGEAALHGPDLRLVLADALLDDWPTLLSEVFAEGGGFDVVVGNPPFLNQLASLTARRGTTAAALAVRAGGALRPYTDASALFLQRSMSWLRAGGRAGLVQPQSVLAARDAGGVRADLAAGAALESLWASDERVFGAQVLTCAPVVRRGGAQGPVRRTHGPRFRALPAHPEPDLHGEWSFLLAAGLGLPEVSLPDRCGTVADLAMCTADFRDQYYGLAPFVREAAECPAGVPLVTTGLIEPASCLWGRRDARFHKRRWSAPVVDLEALSADPLLARWAAARLVPKVLLATQGRVLEAVADPDGAWLPSVPTVTVATDPDKLWHVLAVLLAPPLSAYAAARYAGTALTMRAIKLSARQVGSLPLPVDRAAWDHGADLARKAHERGAEEPDLSELAATMCAAYDVRDGAVLEWWLCRR